MTLLGASGLVGGHAVRELMDDPGVGRLVLPGRRPVDPGGAGPRGGQEVRRPVVDFAALATHRDVFNCDQLLVCLGTTRRDAGSAEAFRRVDHDYVVEAARLAAEEGARDLLVVSSLGADAASRFLYPRVKGEMEAAVSALPFRSVAILRPSLLLGRRRSLRPTERLSGLVFGALGPLMRGPLAVFRPIRAADVARAMVRLAADPEPGVRVVSSDTLREVAAA